MAFLAFKRAGRLSQAEKKWESLYHIGRHRPCLFFRAIDPRWLQPGTHDDELQHEALCPTSKFSLARMLCLWSLGTAWESGSVLIPPAPEAPPAEATRLLPLALPWQLDTDRSKRVRGGPVRFRVRPASEPDEEPPLFAVITEDAITEDAKNDAHIELWDVPASEYDASGIEPEAQPVVALTPAAARLYGFDEAQQRLHPRISLPGDRVRAFTPDTSLTVSTSLLPAAILAHPRPASGGLGSILIDGRPGSVPQGKALLDAVFSERDGEHGEGPRAR